MVSLSTIVSEIDQTACYSELSSQRFSALIRGKIFSPQWNDVSFQALRTLCDSIPSVGYASRVMTPNTMPRESYALSDMSIRASSAFDAARRNLIRFMVESAIPELRDETRNEMAIRRDMKLAERQLAEMLSVTGVMGMEVARTQVEQFKGIVRQQLQVSTRGIG